MTKSLMQPGADVYDALEQFMAMIERPAWQERAACRGMGTEMFFAERGQDVRPAKAICAGCTVTEACGSAAQEFGIWAGVSGRVRRLRARDA